MKKNNGIGIADVITVSFIILKLTGNIDWSWWWVLSPIWIGAILLLTLKLLERIERWRSGI